MATIIVSMKIMPSGTDVKLDRLQQEATHLIKEFGGDVGKVEIEPIAFGLKALILKFVMDESRGSTDSLEESISKLDDVQSVEVTDVRRAIG